MCERFLYTQCETTQVRGEGSGAALFGYTKLYGQVPGGQAEYPDTGSAVHPHLGAGGARRTTTSSTDVLPTAWQAVEYAAVPDGGSHWGWDRSAIWHAG